MRVIDAVTYLGVAGTFIGIPLTYILARRGRQRPDLHSAHDFNVLIEPKDEILDRLIMQFDDVMITSVSRTVTAIWNERGDTVRGTDILPTDPLRLELEPGDYALNVRVLAMSRPQIGALCTISPDGPDIANISFDFLDAGDGFIVELLHMKTAAAKLSGTIRGAVVARDGGKRHTDLSSERLDMVTARAYRRPFMGKNFRKLLPNLVGTVAVAGALIATGVLFWTELVPTPHLVSVSGFNLTTMDGQRQFSAAVTKAGNTNRNTAMLWTLAVLVILNVALSARSMRKSYGSPIPRSILKNRLDSPTEEDSESSTEQPRRAQDG